MDRFFPLAVSVLMVGCGPYVPCNGPDCEIPALPWDPGGGAGGGGYGSGDGGDDSGTIIEETGTPPEIVTVRDCAVTYDYQPSGSYTAIAIAGAFNGWTETPLSDGDGDGIWSADLGALAAGAYPFKLVFDGAYEGNPPANVYTQWSDGVENRSLRVGDCGRPLLQVTEAAATASGDLAVEVLFALAADESPLDPGSVSVTVGGQAVAPQISGSTVRVEISGLVPGKHSVLIRASDAAGRSAENGPVWVPLWVEAEPFSWEDGLMYFAFTDRFRNGDYGQDGAVQAVAGVSTTANYQGGDFLGIIHAMEEGYFEDLGVNVLWLSPVYENAEGAWLGTDGVHTFSGYHGYWPVSPTAIEARFGDVSAELSGDAGDRLDELIATAHANGVRVLFDLVLNHVHEDHSYLAEHPDWFGPGCVCGTAGCGWEEKPVECWFTDYLPDLSYRNHDLLQTVVDDTLALIRDHDVDAIRIDAAKHMDHVIMRTLSMRLRDDVERASGTDFYIIGETFSSDRGLIMDYVASYELDAQFDFPLYYSVRSAFISGGSFRALAQAVSDGGSAYGGALMSPFLGNHDVPRFATDVSGVSGDPWSGAISDPMASGGAAITQQALIDRTALAFTFVLTQRGVPLIYYGDEIGLHGGADPDNRRMMNFAPYLSANQSALLERVQAVGQARRDHAALRRGGMRELWVEDDRYVYARDTGGGTGGDDLAIIALNKGAATAWSVPVSGMDGVTFTDALGSGRSATVSGGQLPISLGAMDAVIWVAP